MPKKYRVFPSVEYLNECLYLCHETGVLYWKKRPARHFTKHPSDYLRWNTKYSGMVAGTLRKHGYVVITIDYKQYLAHRLVWLLSRGTIPVHEIDHINGKPADNRPVNLREATHLDNSRNSKTHKNNKLGMKGVCFKPDKNKYKAYMTILGKQKHLGYFTTSEEAKAAYDNAASSLHGEFFRS